MKRKPEVGELIEMRHNPVFGAGDPTWVEANVEALLDTQFTVMFPEDKTGRIAFHFYHDQGDSWRFKQ